MTGFTSDKANANLSYQSCRKTEKFRTGFQKKNVHKQYTSFRSFHSHTNGFNTFSPIFLLAALFSVSHRRLNILYASFRFFPYCYGILSILLDGWKEEKTKKIKIAIA